VKRSLFYAFILVLVPVMLFANGLTTDNGKPDVEVWNADISLATNQTYHMTNNNNYILKNGVFVDSDCVLIIDSGTVVKGEPGTDVDSKYLCVARGGQIFANGTANYPIIFTSVGDDIDDPYDIPYGTNGLWGGILILGRASINATSTAGVGVNQIEGIPSTNPKGEYGGGENPDDEDNSGVFRYVSIRHGGTEIGAANEINGLTMGAVGSGTVIEYVEVFNNYDDGFEWFGGTVNTKHLISAFNGDDAFDYDEGFRGMHQFWFVIQDSAFGNRCGEHDGGTTPETGEPYSQPWILNATYIGSGNNSNNADNDRMVYFRDNAGGHYWNGVFTEFAGVAYKVEDLEEGEDSRARLEAGEMSFKGNIYYKIADNTAVGMFDQDFVYDYVTDPVNANVIGQNPGLVIWQWEACVDWAATIFSWWTGVTPAPEWYPYVVVDPRIIAGMPAATPGVDEPADPFFDNVGYRGAFAPYDPMNANEDGLWLSPWSYCHFLGMVWTPEHPYVCGDANNDCAVNVSDAVYIINYVFVGGSMPNPYKAADANCDDTVNVSDAVYIINYVFTGGDDPCDIDGDGIPDC
jgi:hypothetical protein